MIFAVLISFLALPARADETLERAGREVEDRMAGILESSGGDEARAAAGLALGLRGDPAARVRLASLLNWRVSDAATAGLSRARPAGGPEPSLAALLVER